MQDLISIVNSLVMISGSVLIAAVTVAPLLYAWSRSGELESPSLVLEVVENLTEINKSGDAIAQLSEIGRKNSEQIIAAFSLIPTVPTQKLRSAAKSTAIAQVVITEDGKTPTTVHEMRKALIARGVNGAARFDKDQCLKAMQG